MERAGRLLGKMNLSREGVSPEQMARSAWPLAVGKRLAARTGQVSLVRESLVVEVEDAVWQRQLWAMRGQILTKVQQVLGPNVVTEVEFRIRVPRYEPQREEQAVPAAPRDEADGIADPFLRQLYVAARKKATA